MALTAAGLKYITNAIVGQGTPFNSANAYLGVGNGREAFNPAQTDLQGTSIRKKVDSGYPIVTAPTLTFKATFEPTEANFSWNEWGLFNAATGGVMLSRTVQSIGTKNSTQTWILEVDITFGTDN